MMHSLTKRKSKGFSLVELLIVLSIAAFIGVMVLRQSIAKNERAIASGLVAQQLAGVANAVRQRISFANALADFPAATQTFAGINWLQDPACAGGIAPAQFLPCTFPVTIAQAGGIGYTTTVNNVGGVLNAVTVVDDGAGAGYFLQGGIRPDLAGAAIIGAAGYSVSSVTPAGLVTFVNFQSDPDTAIITIAVDTNPAGDPWLRTDGSNTMNGVVAFSGAGFDIDNANDVEASTLTDKDNNAFFVDPNGISQLSTVNASSGNIGDLVSNNLSANNAAMNAANIGGLTVDTIDGRVVVSDVSATGFMVDKDDTNFFLDLNGVSRVNDMLIASRGDLPLSALLPRMVMQESYIVVNNGLVPKPACAATGTARIIVVPNTTQAYLREAATDNGAAHTKTAALTSVTDFKAIDNGADWTVQLLSFDYDSGTYRVSANNFSSAIAEVYCRY